jgi:hypothetical protein
MNVNIIQSHPIHADPVPFIDGVFPSIHPFIHFSQQPPLARLLGRLSSLSTWDGKKQVWMEIWFGYWARNKSCRMMLMLMPFILSFYLFIICLSGMDYVEQGKGNGMEGSKSTQITQKRSISPIFIHQSSDRHMYLVFLRCRGSSPFPSSFSCSFSAHSWGGHSNRARTAGATAAAHRNGRS